MEKNTRKKTTSKTKTVAASAKNNKRTTKDSSKRLRWVNAALAVLFAAQAAAIALLANKDKGDVSLTANYLVRDPSASEITGHNVLAQATEGLWSLNLSYLIAAFLGAAALASLVAATVKWRAYDSEVKAGANKSRFSWYILSLGLVLVTACLIVGLSDVVVLALLLSLLAMSALSAKRLEAQRYQKLASWDSRLTAVGVIVPLAALVLYILFAHFFGGGLPLGYLAAIGVLGLGLLVSALALNNVYKTNTTPAKYASVERAYLLFGFLVPSAFAWAIFVLLLK